VLPLEDKHATEGLPGWALMIAARPEQREKTSDADLLAAGRRQAGLFGDQAKASTNRLDCNPDPQPKFMTLR